MRYQESPTWDLCREFPQEEGELAQILSKEKPVTHILVCNFSTSKTLGGEKWSKQSFAVFWGKVCSKLFKMRWKTKAQKDTQLFFFFFFFFFLGCVPHGFPKVESRELIFLEKWGVLGTKNFENLASWELQFWPKQGWKCKIVLKIEKGAHERCIDGKLVG